MRAVVFTDGVVQAQERPDPIPRSEELLVKVAAAGLNGADLGQLAGRYPPPDPHVDPAIPGLEMAGTVVEVGSDVTRFSVGDKVMAVVAGAGQAELATVHERLAIAVPEGIELFNAGGFCEVFFTAHDALFHQANLSTGDRVLISGGAGGVGIAGVQLGVQAGAKVTASVRAEELREKVTRFGAHVIDPDSIGEHGPYDVILELVGAPNMPENLHALAPWGRIVVIGTSSGRTAEIDFSVIMAKWATVRASTLRRRSFEEKAMLVRRIEHHVLPLFVDQRLQVPIEATYTIEEAPKAYAHFIAGRKLGKILITP